MKLVDMKSPGVEALNTGLDKKARMQVAKALSQALAETYMLQLKTQFYHWNVTGPHFIALHEMFGAQYDAIVQAVDALAERIRALGGTAPGTFREFSALSGLTEDKSVPANWQAMVKNLLTAHETVVQNLRKSIEVAQHFKDEATTDMLIGRLDYHEKTAWMLRSHLGK